VDSFDYKPELAKYHGKALPEDEKPDVFFGKVGLLHQSHWPFKQRGQSGTLDFRVVSVSGGSCR
jgi:hypothetical protein